MAPMTTIALTAAGLQVNGEQIGLPTTVAALTAALGATPRVSEPGANTLYAWDELGVVGYVDDGATAHTITLLLVPGQIPAEAKTPFRGEVTVDGADARAYYEAHPEERVPLYERDQDGAIERGGICLRVYYDFEDPTRAEVISLSILKYTPPPPNAPDAYVHRPLDEPVLEFEDFGFKLSVVQELMYEQGVLSPRFDLYEFVEQYGGRAIDLDEEGYDPIEEVTQWFRDLEVPARLAPLVIDLGQDGGNDIYHQLIHFPEGYEEYWDIETTADAAHFPNLKTATICYGKPGVVDELKARGIDADWL